MTTYKMNCSAISLARTATNGCALKGTFCNLSTATVSVAAMATPTTNGVSNPKNIVGATSSNQINLAEKAISNNNNNNNINNATIVNRPTETEDTEAKKSKNAALAAKIIQQSHIVCFDVDSTVISEEGIDELADFCGKGAEVARVTKEAMGGSMTFQDALRIRLNIIRPTQRQITDFIKLRPSTLTPNVKCFIEQLRANNKQIYLISGGFDCLIEPVARELGVDISHLYANKLMFYHNGDYASFDANQPTSKSGGKAEAIALIKRQHPDALITMIGDGATDLEAVPPANYFIGFGGNVMRAEVYKRAQYYVTDFDQLM